MMVRTRRRDKTKRAMVVTDENSNTSNMEPLLSPPVATKQGQALVDAFEDEDETEEVDVDDEESSVDPAESVDGNDEEESEELDAAAGMVQGIRTVSDEIEEEEIDFVVAAPRHFTHGPRRRGRSKSPGPRGRVPRKFVERTTPMMEDIVIDVRDEPVSTGRLLIVTVVLVILGLMWKQYVMQKNMEEEEVHLYEGRNESAFTSTIEKVDLEVLQVNLEEDHLYFTHQKANERGGIFRVLEDLSKHLMGTKKYVNGFSTQTGSQILNSDETKCWFLPCGNIANVTIHMSPCVYSFSGYFKLSTLPGMKPVTASLFSQHSHGRRAIGFSKRNSIAVQNLPVCTDTVSIVYAVKPDMENQEEPSSICGSCIYGLSLSFP